MTILSFPDFVTCCLSYHFPDSLYKLYYYSLIKKKKTSPVRLEEVGDFVNLIKLMGFCFYNSVDFFGFPWSFVMGSTLDIDYTQLTVFIPAGWDDTQVFGT